MTLTSIYRPCPDCGKPAECKFSNGRAYPRRCDDCGLTALRARQRASMAKVRRRGGIPEVKGRVINCERCSAEVTLNRNARARYCQTCSQEAARERARSVSDAKPRTLGRLGEPFACRHCERQTLREARRQKLCKECRQLNDAGKLPNLIEARRRYRRDVLQPRYQDDPEYRSRQLEHYRNSRKRRYGPAMAMNERMSAGVRYSLATGKQGSSWEVLVGFTLAELMTHLEAQFLTGMTWDNHGEWHIDHIRPLCSFEFTTPDCPQFREAWALGNLRPLWAIDNIRKGGRWEPPAE